MTLHVIGVFGQIRSLRLSVRTRGFHPRKRGSIPLGTATQSPGSSVG